MKTAIHELQEKIFLAELEGPADIVVYTSRMMQLETQLMSDFYEVLARNCASEFPANHFDDGSKVLDAEFARLDVRTDFTREARVILGGVL
ncbi:hypothetical protein DEJ48_20140 [Streptomyces venezuelae]|uniref:Uncharacterized protein n=1 Tax=Streptomyces venezuelae TaxID=54571 RepID=A0A5P2C0I4_STRVZ|nr:hypothetical protein DEJ48_20140 [Streptomyces venezuelae]